MPPVKKVKAKKSKTAATTKDELKEEEEMPVIQPVISEQLSKKLLKMQKKQAQKERGIVFIKHLPHGFFEEQLKNYFQQFGTVTRLRLVRSRRTGGSKGFAFVEFEYPEVAQVAAETMDNYLMFQKLVKAAYIPPDKQMYNYFKSTVRKVKNKAGKTIFVSSKSAAIKRKTDQHNEWSADNTKKRTEASVRKIQKLNDKYKHLGVDFSTICLAPKVDETAEASADQPTTSEEGAKSVSGTKKSLKQSSQEVLLQDLLGSTLPEDSDDEDWSGSEAEDYEDTMSYDSNEEEDEDDEEELVVFKKTKPKVSIKPLKATSNEEKMENMLKRKPQAGGIKKMGKKTTANKKGMKAPKGSMLLTAAKEMAKPMSKINFKQKGAVASKKKVQKIKNE